jgi:hypothetical protein
MKGYWISRGIKFFLLFLIFFSLATFATMWLWNSVLAMIFHWPAITYWQALAIMVLGRLIFGFGRGSGWHSHSHHAQWKSRMAEKWRNMTPEERERMRSEWKSRCGKWGWEEPTDKTESQAQQL